MSAAPNAHTNPPTYFDHPEPSVPATATHFDRAMPQNIDAEQAVLGGMLMNVNAVATVVETLHGDDFYRPAHALIFNTIIHHYARSAEIDPITIASTLDRDNQLDSIGGAAYLHTIMSKTPTSANVDYYANIVKEKSLLRHLVHAGTRVVQLGYSGIEGAEVTAVMDKAQQEILALGLDNAKTDYSRFEDVLPEVLDEIEALEGSGGMSRGVPTGFRDLDDLTNGLHPGQMVIVAARPGVGKSTLAVDFMRSCSVQNGLSSALFSLEMSKPEVMMRILSAEANVRLSAMRAGKMNEDDWKQLTRAVTRIEHAPIFIDDSPNLTMMEIRAKARRLKQQNDLRLVVVDYLQLMSSGKRVESRQIEVSEFSRQLKLLAKEIEVPVIAVSQLNRGVESRGEDAEPRVSDLRESGSLEQDADMVMLLNRPDSTNRDHARAGEADIILAKHRGGAIGKVTVAHQLQYSKFANMASDAHGF